MSSCLLNIYTWSAAITNGTCVKLLKFQIFCPKFAPSLPTVHLIHFLSSFFCPHQNPWGQSFLSHSISNLIGKDGASVFKPHPPLLPSLLAWPSPLTRMLNYPFKIRQILFHFHFTHVRNSDPENSLYCSHVLPLLSNFYHLHTFLWYHVNISDMFLFKL